jgi:hypothetical protein
MMEIRERPPSTLKNVDGTPREVVTEIRECPPSMLKNVDGGAYGRWCRRSGSTHHSILRC